MKTIVPKGKYYIPGRGVIFTADERDHDFPLRKLKENDELIISGNKWKVNHLEMSTRCKVIGICVRPSD